MEHEENSRSYLERLITTRNDLVKEREVADSKRQAIVKVAKGENRDILSDEEDREFRQFVQEIKRLDAEIKNKDELIQDLDEENQRKQDLRKGAAIAERASAKASVTEAATYTKEAQHQRSFFKDLALSALGRDGSSEASERLRRHAQDVQTLPEYQEYRVGLNTTVGDGGTFTPPAYLLDQYIIFARPGRPFADIVSNYRLPGGTMQINVPKVVTGTAVGWQTTQNSNLTETDLTDAYVTANVDTIGGNQILSRQLIDQAGLSIDEVVFRDLTAAHAQFLDGALFTGSGSGQITGINGISGIQTVAAGGLTVQFVYAAIANAIQLIHTTRFQPPDAVVMHPRRWGWFLSLLDSQDRPLFLPNSNHPYNAAGILERVSPQAVVGNMQGLPVIADPNIPTNLGGGSNQDPIYVVRSSDLALYEGGLRAEAWPQTYAQQLSVLLQVSSYVAFLSRYPQSIVEITGLTPPTWGS